MGAEQSYMGGRAGRGEWRARFCGREEWVEGRNGWRGEVGGGRAGVAVMGWCLAPGEQRQEVLLMASGGTEP